MTLYEVKQYYGKYYRKILCSLKDTFSYKVDESCGEYLELECRNNGTWLKINHGISNQYPYNVWYRKSMWDGIVFKHFASQRDTVEYINQLLGE